MPREREWGLLVLLPNRYVRDDVRRALPEIRAAGGIGEDVQILVEVGDPDGERPEPRAPAQARNRYDSRKLVVAALDSAPVETGTERLMLTYLARHHNARRGEAHPTIAYLVRHSKYSRSSVTRALAGLVEKGLVRRELHFNPRTGGQEATRYFILAPDEWPGQREFPISHRDFGE